MARLLSNMGDWLTGLPVWGQFIMTFFISMIPVIELRGAIPLAAAAGMPWPLTFIASALGNMLPVSFIVVYIRRVFLWLKDRSRLAGLVYRLEKRASAKAKSIYKYELLGLAIFVAIPLPGTGAWTGALVAGVLNMRLKYALPAILSGVLAADAIICVLSYGVKAIIG